jgi:hypothetical protein
MASFFPYPLINSTNKLGYNMLEVKLMPKSPRHIGDEHVKSVHQALLLHIRNNSIMEYPLTVIETVHFIMNKYSNINFVTSKFDAKQPDYTSDLTLYLNDNSTISVNIFIIKKGGRIQPKNPGAKSFLKKYFLSEKLQKKFNSILEKNYLYFLSKLIEYEKGIHYISDEKELKRLVSTYFPKFTNGINPYRESFLYSLRETCFHLLKDSFNEKSEGYFHAYNEFFMTKDFNVITSYGKDNSEVSVSEFNIGKPHFGDINVYKIGKSTVGIKFGRVALTLRFKFESGPNSSIKLAASYESFREVSENEIINLKTIQKMTDMLYTHQCTQTLNASNAIGKCHESLTYYYFLKEFPSVTQVDPNESISFLDKYLSLVKPNILEKLYKSTATVVPVIKEKLNEKYKHYRIESIELVPDSYIDDPLNTGDLQLVLKVGSKIEIENISLKALAKKNNKITTKNPGIGTILGPTYFNIGNIDPVVNEVKAKFQIGELNHKESLVALSNELGLVLSEATQEQLKQGIENLLGKAITAITFYEDGISYCKEHSKINSIVKVYLKKPSNIQNTLSWNNNEETLSLRVKFSKGQNHGWSTIKLTSEYQLNNK